MPSSVKVFTFPTIFWTNYICLILEGSKRPNSYLPIQAHTFCIPITVHLSILHTSIFICDDSFYRIFWPVGSSCHLHICLNWFFLESFLILTRSIANTTFWFHLRCCNKIPEQCNIEDKKFIQFIIEGHSPLLGECQVREVKHLVITHPNQEQRALNACVLRT